MKKVSVFLRSIILLFAASFVSTNSYATHILAMDLYYTWVTGNTYKITAVIYGDCGAASAASFATLSSASPQICIFRENTHVATINLTIEAPSAGVDVTPVCASHIGQTQCEDPNSTIPGITKFVYSANYTLPAPVNSPAWRFAYFGQNGNGSAGKSASITNIVNPGGTSLIQLVDTLNNSLSAHNSNAEFSVIPTPFFCLNEADTYNPSAVDPDHDSLSVIDLIPAINSPAAMGGGPPLCQFGVPVTYTGTAWNPPFTPVSAATPLTVVAGSYIYNSATGQLNFTPNALQRSTVVYNVREYRAGHFIGSSQREMNFLVQSCVHTPPTGGVGTVSNGIIVDSAHVTTCNNSGPFAFSFDPREPGTTNNITVTWSGLPATVITPTLNVSGNSTPTPHVSFSWTSTGVPPGTYIFYLTYTDNNCPLQGTNTTAISVTILPTSAVTYTIVSPNTCSPKEAINIMPRGSSPPWTVVVTGSTPQTFTGVTGNFIDSLPPGKDTIFIVSSTASRCDTSATIIVPSTDITGDTIVCAGSAITLSDAFAGGTWSSSNTAVATVPPVGTGSGIVTGVSAGVATISYFFPAGCFKTATVTVKPLPALIKGTMHVCTGLTTTLSDATHGGIWTSGATSVATVDSFTGVVTGVSASIVPISYTAGGCSISASVTVDLQPSVIAGSPNICKDGTAILVSKPGGGVWSSANTSVATIIPVGTDSALITGIAAGATIITYSLPGCFTTATIHAVATIPGITGQKPVCTGQSIILSDAVIGGTWTSGNTAIAIADPPSGTISGVSPGVPGITYSIGGSCVKSTTITVNQSPDYGAITGISDLCVGATTMLSDTISGGIWNSSNGTAAVSGGVVLAISPGTDTIRYIVSNTLCTDTATKGMTIYPVPDSGTITGPSVVCTGATIRLSDASAGGVWSSALPGIASVTATAIVTGISAGTDTIKYRVSNPGCAAVATHVITVYDYPAAGVIYGPAKVCADALFILSDTVSGGVWSSGNTAIATINSISGSVHALTSGATTITYTTGPNLGNCYGTATFTMTVTAQATLIINSNVSQVSCYGDNNGSISVTMSGGTPPVLYQYLWSTGDTTTLLTGLVPGIYTLHVSEPSTLCMAVDTLHISQPDTLILSAEAAQDICKTGTGSITTKVIGGTPIYQYQWSDNSTGSSLQNLHSGTYSVTVTDMNGCSQALSIQVTDNDCIIVVHDVITPNGDGVNDAWIIEGIDNYPKSTVQVFDKWGDIVYEKTDYNNDWNGRGKNGVLPDGTYYYIVKLNSINLLGGQNTFKGTILLKR